MFAPSGVRRLGFRAPENYTLFQNYPNPFNLTTRISFSLSQRCYVSLKVFDSIGKEVATLVNETLEAGEHEVNFNALNFSSGMYFSCSRSKHIDKK